MADGHRVIQVRCAGDALRIGEDVDARHRAQVPALADANMTANGKIRPQSVRTLRSSEAGSGHATNAIRPSAVLPPSLPQKFTLTRVAMFPKPEAVLAPGAYRVVDAGERRVWVHDELDIDVVQQAELQVERGRTPRRDLHGSSAGAIEGHLEEVHLELQPARVHGVRRLGLVGPVRRQLAHPLARCRPEETVPALPHRKTRPPSPGRGDPAGG